MRDHFHGAFADNFRSKMSLWCTGWLVLIEKVPLRLLKDSVRGNLSCCSVNRGACLSLCVAMLPCTCIRANAHLCVRCAVRVCVGVCARGGGVDMCLYVVV